MQRTRRQTGLDYYHILGVSPTAAPAAIRAAYHRLAKLKHPDKDCDNPRSTQIFQQVDTTELKNH